MLRKRIIFTLIYNQGYFMQSRNFRLQKVGDINWLEKNYQFQKLAFSLDELIILNASRADKSIIEFSSVVNRLSHNVFIPLSAGGGVKTMRDAEILFQNGADKIIVNSSIYHNPNFIKELTNHYGSQSIAASIDYQNKDTKNVVLINNGTEVINRNLEQYLNDIEKLQIGEIYLNSINQDGTGFGYDFKTIEQISSKISCPLIIAGGAGNENHLLQGLMTEHVSAVATANLFNFVGDGLANARKKIIASGLNIAQW
jgi:imidazole glycerol-phosphate synthase subunit HisF